MSRIARATDKKEFGDFQTPPDLATTITSLVRRLGVEPQSILEPTCGLGNLLLAAFSEYPDAVQIVGVEISPAYVSTLREKLSAHATGGRVKVFQADFFDTDWPDLLGSLAEPILIIGNPPWVTNSDLGALGGTNLPGKTNFKNHKGLDALTGKSNFDISEWMLINILTWLKSKNGFMAMLCKTAVARKIFSYSKKNNVGFGFCAMYLIDAKKHFGAAVDACLFVCEFGPHAKGRDCYIFDDLCAGHPRSSMSYRDGILVSHVAEYERSKHLCGAEIYKWRSGIKHDCSNVMEFVREGDGYKNGFGEYVEMEDKFLYPMLKTSQVANSLTDNPTRFMLVPQRQVGEETQSIKACAPQTWNYLVKHGDMLDRRGSSIYKNRPRFSIFGIGDYSFAPWKVAISGFYKKLKFKSLGNVGMKPIMLDDGTYFVACQTQAEAELIEDLLNSVPAQRFFESFIFWDAKRPITIEVLRRIDLLLLARELGLESQLLEHNSTVSLSLF